MKAHLRAIWRASLIEEIQPDPDVLRAMRLEAGFTLADFAQRCGLEEHQLAQVEAGKRRLSVRQVERLLNAAKAFAPKEPA